MGYLIKFQKGKNTSWLTLVKLPVYEWKYRVCKPQFMCDGCLNFELKVIIYLIFCVHNNLQSCEGNRKSEWVSRIIPLLEWNFVWIKKKLQYKHNNMIKMSRMWNPAPIEVSRKTPLSTSERFNKNVFEKNYAQKKTSQMKGEGWIHPQP